MTVAIAEVQTINQVVNQAEAKKLTFADFLEFSSDTKVLYELENGELIQMAAESEINQRISMFLVSYFLRGR